MPRIQEDLRMISGRLEMMTSLNQPCLFSTARVVVLGFSYSADNEHDMAGEIDFSHCMREGHEEVVVEGNYECCRFLILWDYRSTFWQKLPKDRYPI